jgi:hypothetical protein
LKRRLHPRDANRVHVPAEHQRRPKGAALEYPDHVGPVGRDLRDLHGEAGIDTRQRDPARHVDLAPRARHERRVHRIDGNEFLEQRDRRVEFHYAILLDNEPASSPRGARSII